MTKTDNNSEKEVLISRIVNARRELVFKAWTDPEHLKQWYAPVGCTIHFKKIDIREGGSFHSCISNPEYGDCWCIGDYLEIKAPERIVQTMINADENGNPIDPASIGMDADWPGTTILTVTFDDLGDKTKLTLRQTVNEELAKRTGAYPSWLQMLERMEALLLPA